MSSLTTEAICINNSQTTAERQAAADLALKFQPVVVQDTVWVIKAINYNRGRSNKACALGSKPAEISKTLKTLGHFLKTSYVRNLVLRGAKMGVFIVTECTDAQNPCVIVNGAMVSRNYANRVYAYYSGSQDVCSMGVSTFVTGGAAGGGTPAAGELSTVSYLCDGETPTAAAAASNVPACRS
jgi:hypothetical protein